MCGRFTLQSPAELIREFFLLEDLPPLKPRFNIAPGQNVGCVVVDPDEGERVWVEYRWGLVPSWAKEPSIGYRMINARSETAAVKASFRKAFRSRRCLIAADGFYEWRKTARGKQPYWIHSEPMGLLAFAGLHESWRGPDGSVLRTCTILTCPANELLAPLHDRMPVILPRDDHELWLDPKVRSPGLLQPLLEPFPSKGLAFRPVSRYVHDARHEGPDCLAMQDEPRFDG